MRLSRIAIPVPHSTDHEYGGRALPQYENAVRVGGGDSVPIALDQSSEDILRIVAECDGVLLPGSNADVSPAKFHAAASPHTSPSDPRRETVDELLLRHAYEQGKPVLGICYGLQSLNVFRQGTLIQHIPDFLSEELRSKVNHEAGRKVAVAHSVEIEEDSKIAGIVGRSQPKISRLLPVNSSHHQSADEIGGGLRIVARCPDDGIIEALEGTSADHWVLAVQWHPERSVDENAASRGIFEALIKAAQHL